MTSTAWWWGSTRLRRPAGRRVRRAPPVRRVRVPGRARAAAVLDLQLQARLLLSVRAQKRRPGPGQRAGAGSQGPGGIRAAGRAGAPALVPTVGDPGLTPVRSA